MEGGMVETLIRNGDGDDYFEVGVNEAEAYANAGSGLKIVEVTPLVRGADHMPKRAGVPFSGYIALHGSYPRFL